MKSPIDRIRAILGNPQPLQPSYDDSQTAVNYRGWIRAESEKQRCVTRHAILRAIAEVAREGGQYVVDGAFPLSNATWMEYAILIWEGSIVDLERADGGSELRLTSKGKRILDEMQQQARR